LNNNAIVIVWRTFSKTIYHCTNTGVSLSTVVQQMVVKLQLSEWVVVL
jgi:hypothetical protein